MEMPGFIVRGNVVPCTEKPVPVGVAALIVTGAVPTDVRVKDCVAAVSRVTFPKETLVALIFSAGTYAFSCRAKFSDAPFAFADKAASWGVRTDVTFAVN